MLELFAVLVLGVAAIGLLVVGLVKFLVFLVALPFRLIGAVAGATAGLLGTVFGGVAALGSVLLVVVVGLGALLVLPLLPLFALFGLIWLFGRSSRRVSA